MSNPFARPDQDWTPQDVAARDDAHLQSLGIKPELQRTLGFLSNFAVAFSYISVATGTFTLMALGLGVGTALAWMVMAKWHLPLALPVNTLFGFTLIAVLAGVGAAVMPARRASRLRSAWRRCATGARAASTAARWAGDCHSASSTAAARARALSRPSW